MKGSINMAPFFHFFSRICVSCSYLAGQGVPWADL